jgi:hypothetical protein
MFQPFIDRRRDAGQPRDRLYVGISKPKTPVVCYNPWATGYEELKAMALAECKKHQTGIRAEQIGEGKFACPLLTPAYIKFECLNDGEKTDEKEKTLYKYDEKNDLGRDIDK